MKYEFSEEQKNRRKIDVREDRVEDLGAKVPIRICENWQAKESWALAVASFRFSQANYQLIMHVNKTMKTHSVVTNTLSFRIFHDFLPRKKPTKMGITLA